MNFRLIIAHKLYLNYYNFSLSNASRYVFKCTLSFRRIYKIVSLVMKISTKGGKKEKGKRVKIYYTFHREIDGGTIGIGTEARSYTLYNVSEERRRSGKANYRYRWNKWGERTKRFVLTNGIFKAIQARETFLWWNTWKYASAKHHPIPTQLPNFVQSTFEDRPCFAHFYCANVKLGVYFLFLRLMRYNKFLRVLRLIKRPRKSGMRRRRRRNSIIPWIMLF